MKKTILYLLIFSCIFQSKIIAQCSSFYDGFESGSYTPTWSIGSGLTSGAVTTTNPAVGLYRLEGTGGTSSHLTGFSTTIAPATPTEMSWWIFPQGTGAANYMVMGNGSVSATNCIAFCYWQGGTNIRFVSSSTFIYNCSPGFWYHIEMKNINYTAHTFDIWINGVLMQTAFPFRNSTQNDVSNIHLYNFNSSVGIWDDVLIGGNPITLSSTITNVDCYGSATGTIDLTASSINPGTMSYLWNNAGTTEDLGGINAGTYSVIVTDGFGCVDSLTDLTVTEPSAISASFSSTPTTCPNGNDGTADVTAVGGTPGYSYLWSNGDATSTATNLTDTTYYVTITDLNGCTHLDSTTIVGPADFSSIITIQSPSCIGASDGSASISVSGATPGYTYLWSNGDVLTTTVNLFASQYYCIITDSVGCVYTDTVNITDPSPITISFLSNNPTTCGGNNGSINATVSGGNPGYLYTWNNSSVTEDIAGLMEGSYTLIVTDTNGCVDSSSTSLNDPTPTTVSLAIPQDIVCLTNAAFILSGGSPVGGTYSGAGVSSGMFTPSIAGVGSHTITYDFVDGNNCASSAQDVVMVNPCLGTEDEYQIQVNIYPNPASNFLNITTNLQGKEMRIDVINDLGQIIQSVASTNEQVVLSLENFDSGVYYVRFVHADQILVKKLIIQ